MLQQKGWKNTGGSEFLFASSLSVGYGVNVEVLSSSEVESVSSFQSILSKEASQFYPASQLDLSMGKRIYWPLGVRI